MTTLLEQVLQTLTQQIHHHHMVHLTVVGLLVTYEVEEGHKRFTAQLVDQFALPEKHDVLLHFDRFFLHRSQH